MANVKVMEEEKRKVESDKEKVEFSPHIGECILKFLAGCICGNLFTREMFKQQSIFYLYHMHASNKNKSSKMKSGQSCVLSPASGS